MYFVSRKNPILIKIVPRMNTQDYLHTLFNTSDSDFSQSVIILTGPTASGKSKAALEIAQEIKGEIINADSMQIYEHLPILTAFPSQDDFNLIPHHLYGVLGDTEIGSAGWWVKQTTKFINEIQERQKIPIIVGGTGLYLMALTRGLSPIPDIPQQLREDTRALSQQNNFYDLAIQIDPLIVGRLNPEDTQRLTRAIEVIQHTGISLFEWQKHPRIPSPFIFKKYYITLPKESLHHRVNQRFIHMIQNGAIEEVEHLLKQPVRQDSPILRAVGVKQIASYLQNEVSYDEMIALSQQASRQYAKRQLTWLKGQGKDYKEFLFS